MSFNMDTNDAAGRGPGAARDDAGLIGFAERFLRLNGAVVERDEAGLDILVPGHLRAMLDTGEYIRISGKTAGTDEPDESDEHQELHEINYGSPVLDRMVETALQKVPILSCCLAFNYIKSGGFKRLLDDQFSFYGAVADIETMADITVDYLFVTCRYRAVSDEEKEGLLEMVFNLEGKTLVPAMAGMLKSAGCEVVFMKDTVKANMDKMRGLFGPIRSHTKKMLSDALKSFQFSMNRRFKRDVGNLEQYYHSLETEMKKSLESPTLSDGAREDRLAKINGLPAEFSRKADDLFKKYSIRVDVAPVAAMIIRTPAKKIVCKFLIGRREKRIFLTYNPVIRAMEPLECSICAKSITHVHFNADLAPVCFDCNRQAR